jgi:copper chaperone CopZ
MRVKTTMASVLIITLALTTMGKAEEVLNYVSSVDIYVDGFICATCVSTLEDTLKQENNVASVKGDLEEGVLHVKTKMDGSLINLFNIEQRINGTGSQRQYSVLKMVVTAVGRVVKVPAEYYMGGLYAYSGDRYKLKAGKTEFILAKNEKLNELLGSGYETVSVEGTVTSYSGSTPVMQLRKFERTLGEAESTTASQEMVPERISSVQIYVDGSICATCARVLKSALIVEEGVAKVDANSETGVVTVTPKTYGTEVNLSDLWDQVNASREYAVRKMDVVAVGHVVKTNAKYFYHREYSHSHDRYILQIGDGNVHFILSENKTLDELINAGYKKVRVRGTVSAFSGKVPVMLIGEFGAIGEKSEHVAYTDPLNAIRASLTSLIDEKRFMEGKEHNQIDSIRMYIDGFICAACEQPLRNDLLKEEGVEIVSTNPDLGMIEVIPKEMEAFELHDLWSRVNATREYKVLKMDVVATGKLVDRDITYGQGTFDQETVKRYMLLAGKNVRFVLSENENLGKMVKSGDKTFIVMGMITAFTAGMDPILEVNNYKKLEEMPEWLKMMP